MPTNARYGSFFFSLYSTFWVSAELFDCKKQKRVFNGKSDPCGSVHITIGDGGNREGLASKYKEQPEWSAFREASFGHGVFNVVNSTHALWGWHRNDDDEPVVSDKVWINSLSGSGCLAKKKKELRKLLLAPWNRWLFNQSYKPFDSQSNDLNFGFSTRTGASEILFLIYGLCQLPQTWSFICLKFLESKACR